MIWKGKCKSLLPFSLAEKSIWKLIKFNIIAKTAKYGFVGENAVAVMARQKTQTKINFCTKKISLFNLSSEVCNGEENKGHAPHL